jgi:hypothetical protein
MHNNEGRISETNCYSHLASSVERKPNTQDSKYTTIIEKLCYVGHTRSEQYHELTSR